MANVRDELAEAEDQPDVDVAEQPGRHEVGREGRRAGRRGSTTRGTARSSGRRTGGTARRRSTNSADCCTSTYDEATLSPRSVSVELMVHLQEHPGHRATRTPLWRATGPARDRGRVPRNAAHHGVSEPRRGRAFGRCRRSAGGGVALRCGWSAPSGRGTAPSGRAPGPRGCAAGPSSGRCRGARARAWPADTIDRDDEGDRHRPGGRLGQQGAGPARRARRRTRSPGRRSSRALPPATQPGHRAHGGQPRHQMPSTSSGQNVEAATAKARPTVSARPTLPVASDSSVGHGDRDDGGEPERRAPRRHVAAIALRRRRSRSWSSTPATETVRPDDGRQERGEGAARSRSAVSSSPTRPGHHGRRQQQHHRVGAPGRRQVAAA